MGVVASNPPPVFPGLSIGDQLTVYFTKPTNRPDVTSVAALNSLLVISPLLATVVKAQWLAGGDDTIPAAQERLVVTFLGNLTTDITKTLVTNCRVSISPSAKLMDASGVSSVVNVSDVALSGSWGIASQPMFLASVGAVALDYGGQEGAVTRSRCEAAGSACSGRDCPLAASAGGCGWVGAGSGCGGVCSGDVWT